MTKKMIAIITLIVLIILIVFTKSIGITTNEKDQGLFSKDGVRGALLDQTVSLRHIDSNLYSIVYLRDRYEKEEIIRRLAYIEGISTVFPTNSPVFIIETGEEMLRELYSNHLHLRVQTVEFAEFLNIVNVEYIKDNDNGLNEEEIEIIEKYYKIYNKIANNYINLTKKGDYKTNHELELAQEFINSISTSIEELEALNKIVFEEK